LLSLLSKLVGIDVFMMAQEVLFAKLSNGIQKVRDATCIQLVKNQLTEELISKIGSALESFTLAPTVIDT